MSRVQVSVRVSYRSLFGFTSVAYLEERDGDTSWGTDESTEDAVILRWTEDRWVEVEEAP